MAKLYEIATGYKNIEYILENGGGNEELASVLNSLDEEIEDKAENIAKLIKNYESDIEAFKTEEKRIAERRRTLENDVKRLKDILPPRKPGRHIKKKREEKRCSRKRWFVNIRLSFLWHLYY